MLIVSRILSLLPSLSVLSVLTLGAHSQPSLWVLPVLTLGVFRCGTPTSDGDDLALEAAEAAPTDKPTQGTVAESDASSQAEPTASSEPATSVPAPTVAAAAVTAAAVAAPSEPAPSAPAASTTVSGEQISCATAASCCQFSSAANSLQLCFQA